jgi:hypothetical protein
MFGQGLPVPEPDFWDCDGAAGVVDVAAGAAPVALAAVIVVPVVVAALAMPAAAPPVASAPAIIVAPSILENFMVGEPPGVGFGGCCHASCVPALRARVEGRKSNGRLL